MPLFLNGSGIRGFETPDELLCIAAEIEHNAAIQYRYLASEMARYGNEQAAEIFSSLAEEEEKHAITVERFQTGKSQSPTKSKHTLAGEAGGIQEWEREDHSPRTLTPLEAFDLAVHNEKRALSFFIHIAAHGEDAAICNTAERLAAEELKHLSFIRRERHSIQQTLPDAAGKVEANQPSDPPRLFDNLMQSAANLCSLAKTEKKTDLGNLVGTILNKAADKKPAHIDLSVSQALAAHITDVNQYCDQIISEIEKGRPIPEVITWLKYLSRLQNAANPDLL
ncbi:ferritin-like domain-containing protein [Aestuariispira ectoiniformans]|uniref:ferritin-like domain-containing protein n=1 Tax=Aestuariispira ectoiniformans TaxID=2775080 RepID=UPI00223B9AAE|nr:ferritin family protein [Aestuariispira ectoiniformans]